MNAQSLNEGENHATWIRLFHAIWVHYHSSSERFVNRPLFVFQACLISLDKDRKGLKNWPVPGSNAFCRQCVLAQSEKPVSKSCLCRRIDLLPLFCGSAVTVRRLAIRMAILILGDLVYARRVGGRAGLVDLSRL
jgi:hypothetical protein